MSNDHKRDSKRMSATTKTISVPNEERIIGTHVYGNLYEIEHNMVDENALRDAVLDAVKIAKMTLVEVKAWTFGGKKGGVSAIALVTESHVAVHIWKEYNYATVDIYTCGDSSAPHAAFDHLVKLLKPKRHQQFFADRSSM